MSRHRSQTTRRSKGAFATVSRAAALLALLVVGSCAPAPSEMTPAASRDGLDFVSFFDGRSYSRGTVTTAFFWTDAFIAHFSGKKIARRLELDEHFAFPDGSPLQRWDLAETTPGRYAGTVSTQLDDGTMSPTASVEGVATGKGVVIAYDGYAPGGGDTLLGFRHEMTPNPDGTVANHVTVSKFGLPLATSDVTFAKTKAALASH